MSDGEAEGNGDGVTVVEKDFLTTEYYIKDNKIIMKSTLLLLLMYHYHVAS